MCNGYSIVKMCDIKFWIKVVNYSVSIKTPKSLGKKDSSLLAIQDKREGGANQNVKVTNSD